MEPKHKAKNVMSSEKRQIVADRHIMRICAELGTLVEQSQSLMRLIISQQTPSEEDKTRQRLISTISDSRRIASRLRMTSAQTLSSERMKQSALHSALELEAEETPAPSYASGPLQQTKALA